MFCGFRLSDRVFDFLSSRAGLDGRYGDRSPQGPDIGFGDPGALFSGLSDRQNGVVITIGSYELLVQDACSGMNSIFALSAIGVFYVYAFRWHEKIRGLILISLIIPITIMANFLRVITLVLIAYYGVFDKIEGRLRRSDRELHCLSLRLS